MYDQALTAFAQSEYGEASDNLLKVIEETRDQSLKILSVEKLVEIYQLQKKYEDLDEHFQYLVKFSQKRNQRLKAKQSLADNEFFKLKNFQNAITHYSQLSDLNYNTLYNRFMVAKSYYFLDNFSQAEYEIKSLLEEPLNKDLKYETLVLNAHLLFAKKRYNDAANAYQKIVSEFSEMAKKNHLGLHLAMSFEQNGLYKKALTALEELQKTYHSPAFVESKISHLRKKLKLVPEGRKLRK